MKNFTVRVTVDVDVRAATPQAAANLGKKAIQNRVYQIPRQAEYEAGTPSNIHVGPAAVFDSSASWSASDQIHEERE